MAALLKISHTCPHLSDQGDLRGRVACKSSWHLLSSMATDKKKNKDDVKENNSRSSQHTGTSPGTQGVMGEANLRRKLQHRSDGEHLRWRSRYDPCSLLWFAQVHADRLYLIYETHLCFGHH